MSATPFHPFYSLPKCSSRLPPPSTPSTSLLSVRRVCHTPPPLRHPSQAFVASAAPLHPFYSPPMCSWCLPPLLQPSRLFVAFATPLHPSYSSRMFSSRLPPPSQLFVGAAIARRVHCAMSRSAPYPKVSFDFYTHTMLLICFRSSYHCYKVVRNIFICS